MRFKVTSPVRQVKALDQEAVRYRKDLRAAQVIATDRASKDGQRAVQQRIRDVGLGRLGGAVGQTSMKREGGAQGKDNPYGVIFARGGDESRGGGTLESYSIGSTIEPRAGNLWLWIATDAVPKFIRVAGRRMRTTPALFNRSTLSASVGKLEFKPIGGNRALLVFRKASVNIRTGRARLPTKRKSKASTLEKDVVAFVGIKVTRRAQRFDHRAVMLGYARRLPAYIQQALDEIRARRA